MRDQAAGGLQVLQGEGDRGEVRCEVQEGLQDLCREGWEGAGQLHQQGEGRQEPEVISFVLDVCNFVLAKPQHLNI